MDANPVNLVKNNLSVQKVIGFIVVGIAVFALFDATGLTNWILFPVTTARAKFKKTA